MRDGIRGQGTIKKWLKTAGSGILLAVLFVLVFAGTLSGAFGIEENLVQNGIIQSNVADAASGQAFSTITNKVLATSVDYRGYYRTRFEDDKSTGTTNKFNELSDTSGSISNLSATDTSVLYKAGHHRNWNWTKYNYYTDYFTAKYSNSSFSFSSESVTSVQDESGKNDDSYYKYGTQIASDFTFDTTAYGSGKFYVVAEWSVAVPTNGGTYQTGIYFTNQAATDLTFWRGQIGDNSSDPDGLLDGKVPWKKAGTSSNGAMSGTYVAEYELGNESHFTFYFMRPYTNAERKYNISIKFTTYVLQDSDKTFDLTNRNDFDLLSQLSSYGNDFDGYTFKVVPDSSNSQNGYIDMLNTEFTPIGKDSSHPFKGSVNGDGKTIKKLKVNVGSYAGLFGYIEGSGTISDITIDEGSVTATSTGNVYAGGLVGWMNGGTLSGTITNKATVTATSGGFVGGVVGRNHSNISNGTFTNSGAITGGGESVGGIFGFSGGTITGATNSGKVMGTASVGGIAGRVQGNIINSTNKGEIVSSGGIADTSETVVSISAVGGITGRTNGTVSGCTNEGVINASSALAVGGIVGYAEGTGITINTCTNAMDVAGGKYTGGIVGYFKGTLNGNYRNTAVIKSSDDYVGGLVGYWDIGGIETNKTYESYGTVAGKSYVGGIFGYINTNGKDITAKFKVGLSYNSVTYGITGENVSFSGLFGGGFFGYAEGNSKITFNDGTNTQGEIDANENGLAPSTATGSVVGGAVGANINLALDFSACTSVPIQSNIIQRSSHTMTIADKTFENVALVGGIVGYNGGTITGNSTTNIVEHGSVFSTANGMDSVTGAVGYVGGAVGYNKGTVENCKIKTSAGVTSWRAAKTGGIVGENVGKIKNCTFSGSVYGTDYVGGLIGYNNGTLEQGAYTNSANVTGYIYVGGIVGYNANASQTLQNFTNTGTISNGSVIGGIAGYSAGAISKCKNTGNITTSTSSIPVEGMDRAMYVGGIVGWSSASITNCYSKADVTASGNFSNLVGGIVGYAQGNVSYCVVDSGKTVEGASGIGGIVGKMAGDLSFSYFLGTISGNWKSGSSVLNYICAIQESGSTSECWAINASHGSTDDDRTYNNNGNSLTTGAGLTVEPQIGLENTTNAKWEDILNQDIDGFKVYGTTSDGTYMSSLHNDNTDGTFANVNTAVPSAVDNGGATTNATNKAGNRNCALAVTYKYGAKYDKNLLVEIKNIAQDSKTREYCANSATLLKPTVPYIGTNGYSYLTLYYSNSDFSDNSAESKRDIGSYYTITDIIIDGKVVGRKTNTLIITAYDFESHFENGEVWFGFSDSAVVSNQDLYTIDGTSYSLYLLNDSENENPHVLVYLNGNYYKIENVVIYYTAYWYWSEGTIQANTNDVNPVKTVKGCSYTYLAVENGKSVIRNNFTLPNFVSALDSGEHVRDGVQITANGQNNFTGSISRYYTLMDSDFSGNINQTNWGSASNPYIIENQAQLIRLSQILNGAPAWNSINTNNKSVSLAQNSNSIATDRTYWKEISTNWGTQVYFKVTASELVLDSTFEPIGNNDYMFMANFVSDDGVTIKYAYENEDRECVGLFGKVKFGKFENLYVQGKGKVQGANNVGGLIGFAWSASIINCTFASSYGVHGKSEVGGLVGHNGASTIKYDYSQGGERSQLVGTSVTGIDKVGGIAGYWDVWNANEITNDGKGLYFVTSAGVTVTGSGNYTGGLVGYLNVSDDASISPAIDLDLTAKTSRNAVTVVGKNYVGALYGALIGNDNTDLNVNDNDDVYASVNASGYVVGGLVGMIERARLVFYKDYDVNSAKITFSGTPSFFGGIVGVAGERADVVASANLTNNNGQVALSNSRTLKGKDMVGGLIGWVAHTAGSAINSTTTSFASTLKLSNTAKIEASVYLGGLVGGIGVLSYSSSDGSKVDDAFNNLLRYGSRFATSRVNNTLVFEPSMAYNKGDLTSTATNLDYGGTGGILGYAGAGTRVNLVGNKVSESSTSFDNAFYYHNSGKIDGYRNVGGIVGYLGDGSHTIQYVVNFGAVGNTSAVSVGGLVGYMVGGTISNCVSAPNETSSSISSVYHRYYGTSNVGGLVGYMQSGTLETSIAGAFDISQTSSTKGGVVGDGTNPTINGAWAIHFAQGTSNNPVTYSTHSANSNGRYVLLDKDIADENSVATLSHVLLMAGLTTETSKTWGSYTFKTGELLVGVNYPSDNINQLAFYDASGNDSVMDTPLVLFAQSSTLVRIGVNMSEGKSYSVCKVEVKFGIIPKYTGSDEAKKKSNAESGYQAPSGANNSGNGYYYTINVSSATYDVENGGDIKHISAEIYFNGTLVGATTFSNQKVGDYSQDFEAGKSETTPYVISTQEEWNDFAYSIYTGAKNYNNEYVKLNTDINITREGTHSGTGNSQLDFSNGWKILYDGELTGMGNANTTAYSFSIGNGNAYKYYWITIRTSGAGGLQMSELDLSTTKGGSDLSYEIAYSRSGNPSSGEMITNINDGNTATKYYSSKYSTVSVVAQFSSATVVGAVKITNGNDNASNTIRTAKYMRVWGSNTAPTSTGNVDKEGSPASVYDDDAKNAGSNLGYNLAGNISQGSSSATSAFMGTFDGNGHKITIDFCESAHRASVFPNAQNATFKNLTIEGNVNATGQPYRDAAGNLAITNDINLQAVAGYDVAGFVGKPFGSLTFENCVNNADVIGLRNVAGILAYNAGGSAVSVTSCVNTGDIISLQGTYTLNGFSDYFKYNENIASYGLGTNNVSFMFGTGGIIGAYTGNITIESCRNAGNIIGGHNVGGIIGLHEGNSSSDISTIVVNNCANTGDVLANSGYWHEDEGKIGGEASEGVRQLIFGYAGGLIGLTGRYSILEMYASYNTGTVTTYSNMVGGLVGAVGAMYQTSGQKNSVATGGRSTIAYCYNVGTVQSGGTFPKRTQNYPTTGGREIYGGSIVGGIAGLVGDIQISQCYNAGDVWQFGLIAYRYSWQMRAGGIVGQSEPSSGMYVLVDNTYNIGTIYLRSINTEVLNGTLGTVYDSSRYAAAISGYTDVEANTTRVNVSDCYSINNCISSKIAKDISGDNEYKKYLNGTNDWFVEKYDQWYQCEGVLGLGKADPKYMRTGRVYNTYDALTAAMSAQSSLNMTGENFAFGQSSTALTLNYSSVGTYSTMPIQSLSSDGTAVTDTSTNVSAMNWKAFPDSWLYVYGCVPQLSVFALDTYNGLSMRSINYGKDIYDEYRRQNAGDEYSPYVIKDGIDLMALQALVDAGYSFDGKYIEFADETNNLANTVAKYINLATYDGSTYATDSGNMYKSSSDGSAYNQVGKSYHLFTKGAIFNRARTKDAGYVGTDYTNWKTSNHYLNGETGKMTLGATFANTNFLPIGGKTMTNAFKGNIDGALSNEKGESLGNVEIVGLIVRNKQVAGLFGWTEGATVSNIAVSGSIESYAEANNSYAGGIVGTARGASNVEGCEAGSSDRALNVTAYSANNKYSDSAVQNVNMGAGGIVGMANTLINGVNGTSYYGYEEGTTLTISGGRVVNATIKTVKNNVGGVVGLVSGYKDSNTTSYGKNNKVEIALNSVINATIKAAGASSCTNQDVGTKIGGVIGATDGYITAIARDNVVGSKDGKGSVEIGGENTVGGIVGYMSDGVGEIVGGSVYSTVNIRRLNEWGEITNAGDSGTAIGGIVGRTEAGSGEAPVTTTFGGNIVFGGNIIVSLQTKYDANGGDSKDGAVLNIGGIVGDMGAGARIATGAQIKVQGVIDITSATDTTHANRNIGGVAGRADDVAFSGSFDVQPTMKTTGNTHMQAYNVGGFIGKNNGIVDILADSTTIDIGGTISGLHDVGGFIGYNAPGQTLRIGADYYRGVPYSSALEITIISTANIKATGDNVGGIVGNNAVQNTGENALSTGGLEIVKGTITNEGSVEGANAVGGIIGINSGEMITGGSTIENSKLTIQNKGNVTGKYNATDTQYSSGMYVGGVIGKLDQGTIAGDFANTGYVKGSYFVGGSIGYVGASAVITASGHDTNFTNGAVAVSADSDEALSASDSAISAEQQHNVEGVNYVGGSIGFSFGTIRGTQDYKVVFTSRGTFDGKKYVGGSIGVLAGVSYRAEFISSADASGVSATTAVGGSVGFIGVPNGIMNNASASEKAKWLNIKVTDTHFEAGGVLSASPSTADVTEAKASGDYLWGGVGGAIGAIGNSANNFYGKSDGVANWDNNTYYASGNVTANNLVYVGGIVGLIKADDITINNMLAYDTIVTGYDYVGGIVGATCGKRTVIDSAFSISTSDERGLFTAIKKDGTAGGIIGLAVTNAQNEADNTNASTSYWVKGYSNAQLAGSNVSDLKNTLGRYTLVSETFTGEGGNRVTTVFTKELIGRPTTQEGDEEIIAIYATPYDYYEAVGKHTLDGVTYSSKQEDKDQDSSVVLITDKWGWSDYFKTTKSNVEFSVEADNWVVVNDNWKGYSTGTAQTGWYFVYANDTVAGVVNAVHNQANDKAYWKRIANAYTADERNNGDDRTPLQSAIIQDATKSTVVGGGEPQEGVLYATATSASASGYYMYIATSNKDVKPSAIHSTATGTDGKFFIKVDTNAKTQTSDGATLSMQAQNVAVYYRSIAMGSSITYNGCERYAPISLQNDIEYDGNLTENSTADTNKANKYYYNTTNPATTPGTYTSDVDVFYYDDLGQAYRVGGIEDGTWKIKKRDLELAITGWEGGDKIYGSSGEDGIPIDVTISNIVATDKELISFALSIEDVVNRVLKSNSTLQNTDSVKFSIVSVASSGKLDGNDKLFNKSNISDSNTYSLTVRITFAVARDYKLDIKLQDGTPNTYYSLESEPRTFSVKPKKIAISNKNANNEYSVDFDFNEHSVSWEIGEFAFKENIDAIVALKPQFKISYYIDATNTSTIVQDLFNGNTWTRETTIKINDESSVTITVDVENNKITLSGAKLKGDYCIEFTSYEQVPGCNYTFENASGKKSTPLSISDNSLTVVWSSSPASHTYDKKTGTITATVTAKNTINNIASFVETYFKKQITPSGSIGNAVVKEAGKSAMITFTTGTDAGKYTAKLIKSGSVWEVQCGCADPGEGTHTIDKAKLTFAPKYSTQNSNTYVYNSYHQGLMAVAVTGQVGGDSVGVSISGDITLSEQQVASGKEAVYASNNKKTSGTIDVGSYKATIRLSSNGVSENYVLANGKQTLEVSWTITKAQLVISGLTAQDVTYDGTSHRPTPTITANGELLQGTFGQDSIQINFAGTNDDTASFVNVGTYDITIQSDKKVVAYHNNGSGADASGNYEASVSDGKNGVKFEIKARQITIEWTNNSLVFNNQAQGQSISKVYAINNDGTKSALSKSGTGYKGYAGGDLINFTVTGKASAAADSHTMTAKISSVTGKNADGSASIAANYMISSGETQGYSIAPLKVAITSNTSSIVIEREYDATNVCTDYGKLSYEITSSNAKDTFRPSYSAVYSIESAVFDSKNVGERTVTLTYKFVGNSNYEQEGELTQTTGIVARIVPKTIEVKLDKLRSGKATRTYNNTVYYGGEDGATPEKSRSATYRSGEGFSVDGWYSVDADMVRIIAVYVETTEGRSDFDKYVNNIYKDSNGNYSNKGTSFYKKLQFSIVGDGASNYNFVVCNGAGDQYSSTIGSVNQKVDIFDQRDTKLNQDQSVKDIQIEITVKSVRVDYANTMQSYVKEDGTYNTTWLPITGANKETDKVGAEIVVTNGWMDKAEGYKSYTVIRGNATSSVLGAKIAGEKGMDLNFRLSNQPILTIGYFITSSTEEMQVSSLAELLIASFYWTASQKKDDSDFDYFMQIVQSSYDWVKVASVSEYDDNSGNKGGYETWDEYFEALESEKDVSIFFNEEKNEWGYYESKVDTQSSNIFTSFKQVKDIDGTFTQADIELLNSFFTSISVDANGNESITRHGWGVGETYLDNIVNMGVGNVAIAIGSLFKSKNAGFTGVYDGGGYVIEYFNIMGFESDEGKDTNVGMFDVIGVSGTVKNLHLRNITISAGVENAYVGGIAGKAINGEDNTVNTSVENVTWHGTISSSTKANIGGLFGYASKSVDKAIALGSITAKDGNIGGLIGWIDGASISNAVSFVYIEGTENVSATVAYSTSNATVTNVTYLASSAWKRSGSNLALSLGAYGTAKTYTQLMDGSASGYASGSEYYLALGGKEYDVIDDIDLSNTANISDVNARQSMRLKDIIDVYVLMFDIKQTTASVTAGSANVYTISTASWLVGTHHGTDNDRIVIANKQNVSLLRELRFASFELTKDVTASENSGTTAYSGAFFGNVSVANGGTYTIDFGLLSKAFEAIVQSDAPFKVNA